MKKLLIIALLVVGCENSTEPCEICDVAWLSTTYSLTLSTGTIAYPHLYYTEGYEPMVIDTIFWCNSAHTHLGDSYDYCIQMCEEQNEELPDWTVPINCAEEPNVAHLIYSLQGDTTTYLLTDSVMSISHFVIPNYFEIIDADSNINTIIYSDDIKYEYK